MKTIRALALLLAAALPALADTPLQGVWQGSLGNNKVRVCFNKDSDSLAGNYYFQQAPEPRALRLKNGLWVAEDGQGYWQLGLPRGDSLSGSWHGHNSPSPLAIKLSRIDLGDDDDCGADAYALPLEQLPTVEAGPWQSWQGTRYRELKYGAESGLEMDPALPQAQVINAWLRAHLTDPEALDEQFETRRDALRRLGTADFDETRVEPVFRNSLWLGVRFYRWAAGYGRSGISQEYRYFSLATGQEVEPWRWFLRNQDAGQAHRLPGPLRAHLMKGQAVDQDCDHGDGSGWFNLGLDSGGLLFWEEAMGDGCELSFALSPQEALAFANSEGREQLKAFADILAAGRQG